VPKEKKSSEKANQKNERDYFAFFPVASAFFTVRFSFFSVLLRTDDTALPRYVPQTPQAWCIKCADLHFAHKPKRAPTSP